MTEQEYINATNKAKISAALEILRSVDSEINSCLFDIELRANRRKLISLEEVALFKVGQLEESK